MALLTVPLAAGAWAHWCSWVASPLSQDCPHSYPQFVQLLFQGRSNQIYVQSKNSRKGE